MANKYPDNLPVEFTMDISYDGAEGHRWWAQYKDYDILVEGQTVEEAIGKCLYGIKKINQGRNNETK